VLALAGRTSWAGLALYSGHDALTGITPLLNWTGRIEQDAGTECAACYTYNTVSTADVTAGWTQTAEDAVAVLVAVSEVAGGHTVVLGQATETDTAQALSRLKAKALGQPSETDTAQALSRLKAKALGQVTETDTAQALSRLKAKALGQVTESDTAQAVTRGGVGIALGQAAETDTAQALSRSKVKAVAQATETDEAQALSRLKARAIAQVTETDEAQAFAVAKARALLQAVEADEAQPVAWAPKHRLIGQASETDTALAITLVGGAGIDAGADRTHVGASRIRTLDDNGKTRVLVGSARTRTR